MKKTAIALGLACLCTPAWAGDKVPVIINEIRIDQPSADDDEYFELKGAPGASLDGLTYLVIGDGTGGSGVIETAVDLTGQSIAADGLFLVGESTLTLGVADFTPAGTNPLNFENSDNVTHLLVMNFTGASGDDLDTDDDGVLDVTPWSFELDRIALVEEDNPPAGTEFHYGPPSVGPEIVGKSMFVPGHVYRCEPDGAWTIGPFDPAVGVDTPGTANPACPQPATGACCLPEGQCKVFTEDECLSLKGVYQGDDTICEKGTCGPAPTGACCLGPGNCQELTADECQTMGGAYLGDGTACDPNPCIIELDGACCLPEGSCKVLTQTFCESMKGIYQGNGVECTDETCLLGCPNPNCPSDINGSGLVDGIDLGNLLANWSIPPTAAGCGGALPCCADLNGDSVVDGLDLGILLANWSIPAGAPGCGG